MWCVGCEGKKKKKRKRKRDSIAEGKEKKKKANLPFTEHFGIRRKKSIHLDGTKRLESAHIVYGSGL
jgi:hypothetical protein